MFLDYFKPFYLDIVVKFLRTNILPFSVRYKFWNSVKNHFFGKRFTYKVKMFNKEILYGGVSGYSDGAIFKSPLDHESEMVPVLKKLLSEKNNPRVIDVGSNNGQYLILVKVIKPSSEIHCFDPFKELTNFSEFLAIENNFSKVFINNCLIGDKHCNKILYFESGATVTATTIENLFDKNNKKFISPQITLDEYCKNKSFNQIDLLKIDVEGSELEVLKGAKILLNNFKPDIILEILYSDDDYWNKRIAEIKKILDDLRYNFYHINSSGCLEYQKSIKPDPSYKYRNYLATIKKLH